MAKAIELGKTQIVTRDGVVTATVLDKVSPDRVMLMLVKGASAARYANTTDGTALVGRDVKDLVVFPFSEI